MRLLRSSFFICCFTAVLAAQPALPPVPGQLFDIGGRRMHMMCSGEGSPTVVFEPGNAAFSIDFTLVQRELEKAHRVCVYDRAGAGWSDPLPAGILATEARDLHRLFAAAKEPAPYVLVGAARGGLLIRAYLAAYPDEVAGLVFIDPVSEDRLFVTVNQQRLAMAEMTAEQMQSMRPRSPIRLAKRPVQTGAPFDALPRELYQQRLILDERLSEAQSITLTPEQVGRMQEHERQFLAALLATRKAGTPLGSRPTIVLSRGDQRNQDSEDVHKALANLSTNSRHTVVSGSGPEVHLFQPRGVIAAVKDVLEAIAKKSQLRPE